MRDNFSEKIKRTLAARCGHLCANPGCLRPTEGPSAKEEAIVNIGVAAHITAASEGIPEKPGPRYDPSLSPEARKHISNGIWLCQTCAKLIDSDTEQFTAPLLREWKTRAEKRAFIAVATSDRFRHQRLAVFELDDADNDYIRSLSLGENNDIGVVSERLRTASLDDIAAFRTTREWPGNVINLTLSLQMDGKSEAVSLDGVTRALPVVESLMLVAPPGTGKTVTLIQLGEKILALGQNIPVVVPLGEWSSNYESIFKFLLRRNAFRAFPEQHFQLLAFYGRLIILIDGWNEVDADSRIHAIRQLEALRRDFPLLCVAIATRRQAVTPVMTPTVEIQPLNHGQQLEMARRFPGGSREAILDQAWRVPGIRDLIGIPLYLNALLSGTGPHSLPETKEEILHAFVTEHESPVDKAERLRKALFGFHKDMLVGLAAAANQSRSTTLLEKNASLAITTVGKRLIVEGQIAQCPQPSTVLDVLVDTHSLVRLSPEALMFQHQQFQEWYASFEVERLMLNALAGNGRARKDLREDVLNWLPWEESVLFACERLSQKDATGAMAVGSAIVEALGIDPILAAEMIYRSSDAVWEQIKERVLNFTLRWHKLRLLRIDGHGIKEKVVKQDEENCGSGVRRESASKVRSGL